MATLEIKADPSQAVQKLREFRRVLYDVSAAADKAEKAVERIGADGGRVISHTAASMDKAAASASKFGSTATDNFTKAARAAGLATKDVNALETATRAAGLKPYGQELDRLRAKFNPIYSALQKYKTSLGEIRNAHMLGAISSSEMAAAIGRERSTTLASVAILKGRTAALNQVAAAARNANIATRAGGNGFQTANIAAQFQDVGVTMAMGMSPLQIALQQGTQLSAVLEQMKASGQSAGAGLRAAFMSIISPTSLVTVGIIAATAAVVQWAMSTEDESEKASDALEAHADVISRIKERYGEAAKELKAYANESAVILKAAAIQAKEANEAVVVDASQSAINKLRSWTMDEIGAQTPLFSNFSKALNDLEVSLASGSPRLLEFRDAIAAIRTSDYATDKQRELADELLGVTQEAEKAARALPQAAAAIEMTGNQARASTTDVDGFTKALRELAGIALPALTDAEKAQETLRKALSAAGNDFVLRKDALKEFADAMARINNEIAGANVPIPTARPNDIERLDDEAKALDKTGNSYDRLIDSAQRRVDQMQTELALVGRAGAEVEAYRFAQDLLSRAKEREIDLTDDQIAKIHELAKAYGEVVQATAVARLQSDLMFERGLIGMTDGDKQIITMLRRIGVEHDSEIGRMIAGQMRWNQALGETQDELEAIQDIGKQAFGEIIDLLYETGDVGDKLISIFAGVGRKFAQMGADKLWKSITGEGKSIFGDGSSASVASAGVAPILRSVAQTTEQFSAVGNDLAANIRRAADLTGASARDLATVISFETGGSFSTSKRGGAGGNHIGLIQFGPEEQRKYGAAIGQTLTAQFDAVVSYLKDRGFKPGMTGQQLYATINTGNPFTGHRSDAANGGTWGSANDKWLHQMGGHQANADRVLSQSVADGFVEGSNRLQRSSSVGGSSQSDPWSGMRGNSAGSGDLASMLGLGGAAMGAFAGGYESGSPLMGGISGAMSGVGAAGAIGSVLGIGAMAATGVGLVVGAIAGPCAGKLGKSKMKESS